MKKVLFALIGITIVAAVVLGVGPAIRREVQPQIAETIASTTSAEVDFFSARLTAHPNDLISATRLGGLLRQLQRETGDVGLLHESEAVLRTVLEQLPGYSPAEAVLAAVLVDLHRFKDGLALAQKAHQADPKTGALLTVGDAQLALGNYDQAESVYLELAQSSPGPYIASRLARLEELKGDLDAAIRMMEKARARAIESGVTGEPIAWYSTRLGDLRLSVLDVDVAESEFRVALRTFPGYAPAIAGIGDVMMARGDLNAAIESFEAATELRTDPDWFITLGYLYLAVDRPDQAWSHFDRATQSAATFGALHPRDFALLYADRGNPEDALPFAMAALEQSGDIYAHDVMAWVLFRLGRLDHARVESDLALALGTLDSTMLYHSGAIWMALGDHELGMADLEQALELGLDPWIETEALRLLDGA